MKSTKQPPSFGISGLVAFVFCVADEAAYPDFTARFRRFLEDHGHREMDMDHYIPPGPVDRASFSIPSRSSCAAAETKTRQRPHASVSIPVDLWLIPHATSQPFR